MQGRAGWIVGTDEVYLRRVELAGELCSAAHVRMLLLRVKQLSPTLYPSVENYMGGWTQGRRGGGEQE